MGTNLVPIACVVQPFCCDCYVTFCIISLCHADKIENGDVYQRRKGPHSGASNGQEVEGKQQEAVGRTGSSWRRILLLILAITIHNIPGQNATT